MLLSMLVLGIGMFLMRKGMVVASTQASIPAQLEDLAPDLPPIEQIADGNLFGKASEVNGRVAMVPARDDLRYIDETIRPKLLSNEMYNRSYQNNLYDKLIVEDRFNDVMRFYNVFYSIGQPMHLKKQTPQPIKNIGEF